MHKALITAFLLAAAPLASLQAQAGDFYLYPGFSDRDALVEMTADKGLMIEIVLRCSREGNKVSAGIMTYSKIERLYCSSRNYCTRDAEKAADDTCGY